MDGTEALRFRAALPTADIHAFEPHPGNFQRMTENPALSRDGISLVPLAVTDHDGTADFFVAGESYSPGPQWRGMSSLHKRSMRPELLKCIPVKTTRLDHYMAGKMPREPRLALWIDVEGKAYEALEGAVQLLQHVHLIHAEVESSPCIAESQKYHSDVRALLHSAGFVQLATDGPASYPQFNALFVRKELLTIPWWQMRASVRRLLGVALRRMTRRTISAATL